MKKHIVLAFSGGLDTSYCLVWLTKVKQLPVHTVVVNTGGFDEKEVKQLEEKARMMGATQHVCIDALGDYYRDGIRHLVFGNVLRNHTYPLSVSAERVFQARAVAQYALESGAQGLAHGSTGAGNDQVRFDMIFMTLAPDLAIMTPVRDQGLSRNEEIEFLHSHGVDLNWQKARYSINQGIWGTSVGGVETLTSGQELPDEAYPTQVTQSGEKTMTIAFQNGEVCAVDGREYPDPVAAIQRLNQDLGAWGIGRDIHVGDTIIGIKGRVAFEAPAALVLIKAHEALEKHVLTKWQIHWKDQLANWYGQLLHEGNYYDPVMRNIESFLTDTQSHVSGEVYLKIRPYHFNISGIKSEFDLMSGDSSAYGELSGAWSGEDVRGFAKITANQNRIYYQKNKK